MLSMRSSLLCAHRSARVSRREPQYDLNKRQRAHAHPSSGACACAARAAASVHLIIAVEAQALDCGVTARAAHAIYGMGEVAWSSRRLQRVRYALARCAGDALLLMLRAAAGAAHAVVRGGCHGLWCASSCLPCWTCLVLPPRRAGHPRPIGDEFPARMGGLTVLLSRPVVSTPQTVMRGVDRTLRFLRPIPSWRCTRNSSAGPIRPVAMASMRPWSQRHADHCTGRGRKFSSTGGPPGGAT
jgi:hypothetical protein